MTLKERLKHYKITNDEYGRMQRLLGREPQGVEWALFSALWSEHCSYKSSKIHLKKLFNQSPRVVQAFGENAGVIDLGDGERLAFKMESHNHPSFIEPFQGATTGVGGILRDIFTMGARPIAVANFLAFGEPSAPRMKTLVDGVVRGIAHYGNCVGVPMTTGQTEFHGTYNKNILVNAMAIGYFGPKDKVASAKASGPGNRVVYVGAKTGRDGIHGASMASESFGQGDEDKRPNVQIGDPFLEKLLIESCLDVIQNGLVVAIQDMGAAGLSSSSFEMAARGGVGFDLHLDKIPLRDASMNPEEILLSESQERMLLICEPTKFDTLKVAFDRWGLDAVDIGEVRAQKTMRLFWNKDILTQIDPNLLTDAPLYERPFRSRRSAPEDAPWKTTGSSRETLMDVLSDARGCDRSWIFGQYDQRVQTQTMRDCSSSVGVIRLPSGRALGTVLGCRPHVMRWNARWGGMDSVAYPSLQLAVKGLEPLAVTDCLNFGSPENVEVMSDFVDAVEGMNEMARAMKTPVISGNVSFYNQTETKDITPTPSTGIVGLRSDMTVPRDTFQASGESVYKISMRQLHTGGLLQEIKTGRSTGSGEMDPAGLARFVEKITKMARLEGVNCSRVVGKFGLGYTLARLCMDGTGFKGAVMDLFGETLYEVLLVTQNSKVLEDKAKTLGLECVKIGDTGGTRLVVVGSLTGDLDVSVSDLQTAYRGGWRKNFEELA